MKLLDMIKTIKLEEEDYAWIRIYIDSVYYLSMIDFVQHKKDSIRIPLEELNIKSIYQLPSFFNTANNILWITKELEYLIVYSNSSDNTIILNFQELKEQDESYLVLKYGKFLLGEI